MKLVSCKSALTTPHFPPPVVYSADHSKAVAPVLVLLFVACGLFYEAIRFLPCVILFLCFSVL